jgi:methylated-DNA-[protein]-cysteine S-methyltransferase
MAGSVEPTPVIASVEPTAHGLIVWWTAMQVVRYAAGDWGVGELWFDGEVPVWHELPTQTRAHAPKGGTAPPTVTLAEPGARDRGDSVPEAARLISRYFAGEQISFADVPIDSGEYTPLQQAIADSLRTIEYGETVTYGELAALAGRPNAPRAAGTFCSHNNLPLILPCHRVVAAGGIGSYGSLGVEYKRRLLELERAAL